MGWGICFALDEQYNLYCMDGCRWKPRITGFVPWPSARKGLLKYYDGPAHRELDMIRDECPGTASALLAACREHMSYAMYYYERMSNEEKTRLHEETLKELEDEIAKNPDDKTLKRLLKKEQQFQLGPTSG